jgi:2-methylcitrate dehydratase
MDTVLQTLADYAYGLEYQALGSKTVRTAIRLNIDAIGCAAGGFESPTGRLLRNIAASVRLPNGSTAYGIQEGTTAEYAVMANVAATRYLDFNDCGVLPANASHPSDATPAILAAVEMTGGSGRDVILGNSLAYDIIDALGQAYDFRTNGWDQGTQIGIATAAAVGRIFRLDRDKIAHAIAITLMAGSPLRVVRTGELSHWKGCATAQASMNAFFATKLARDGMTGPLSIFTGTDGFFKQISGKAFELDHIGKPIEGMTAMERTAIKFFPTEGNSQVVIGGILSLRDKFHVEDIVSIAIAANWITWHEIGGGQGDVTEKWDPQTREGADHSLPFLVAAAIMDGKITQDTFEAERIRDTTLRPLMKKISISCDEELEARFRKTREVGARITIKLKDGQTLVEEVWHPRGSVENPMTDAEINTKFDSMIKRVLPDSEGRRLRDMLWNLDQLGPVSEFTGMLRAWKHRS